MARNRRSVRRAVLVLLVGSLIIPLAVSAGALPPGGTFLDDDFNIHEGNIEAIAAADITRGCNPPVYDRFCPKVDVRRGEMAAFLNRALDLPAATKDHFTDDNTSIFEDDINRLAEAGITLGCNPQTNDRFCPNATVNRGSMAAFLVRAYGYSAGSGSNLFVDDNTSIFENDIDRLGTAKVTLGCNPPTNDRFCPTDPVRRDQMASFLARAEQLDPMVPPPRADLTLEVFASGLSQPVGLVAPDDPNDDRVFVLEKGGTIRIIEGDGTVLPTPFLTISGVLNGSETGLLGMAFHPDYPSDGRFFVHYSTTGTHRSRISSFSVSADPNVASASETVLLTLTQPAGNHNGGHLEFGPDGYLYIGFGDGGGSDDPDADARDPTTLFGSMLRIDVDSGNPYSIPADNPYVGVSGLDEVWSIG
ncbi:MAG: PQQ-dependent sugar dehydrogenase, partial [Gemmatimonadetes bacterium]|nr:PQQ-dependent sugar dehydrogenase [Gemmatimonadota bacterium]